MEVFSRVPWWLSREVAVANGFKDHFSGVARAYQAFRPRYPEALFDWLAENAPGRELAVDLGCGSGQATAPLARHFARVVGIEPSAEQASHAEPGPQTEFRVARAEATGLPAQCADLAVAAQAFHWFDPEPFRRELERIARPGALFAAFTYAVCRVAPPVDAVIDRLYRDIVGPHWPPERTHVESGYRTLPFPWPELPAPPFAIAEIWDLRRLVGYLATWSAVNRYRERAEDDPLALVSMDLSAAWGPPERERPVTFELRIRAGRVADRAGPRR